MHEALTNCLNRERLTGLKYNSEEVLDHSWGIPFPRGPGESISK